MPVGAGRAIASASSRQRRRASVPRSRAHVVAYAPEQRLPAEWDFRWSSRAIISLALSRPVEDACLPIDQGLRSRPEIVLLDV